MSADTIAPVRSSHARTLWAIVLVSIVLRVCLVLAGGQDYWADEDTANSGHILESLEAGAYADALARLDHPDRPLFKVIGIIPAAIGQVAGHPRRVYALFFAMATVVDVWLMVAIARRLGAGEVEALLAAAFLAMSVTFLYWARHVTSYDLAMTFALLALYAGLTPGRADRHLYLSGMLAGCSFLCYPGYWYTGVAVALICCVERSRRRLSMLRYGAVATAGVLTAVGLAVGTSAALGGHLLQGFIHYSGTIVQGTFDEGWSLPFEYLWHAEHLLLALWVVSAAWWVWQPRAVAASPRLRAGLIGVVVIYAMLATCSVLLHKFVVYGRLSRQLVPFFCFIAAYAVDRLRTSDVRIVRQFAPVVVIAMIVQAVVNFRGPFTQLFPAEFIARNRPDDATAARYQRLMWLNTKHLHPGPDPVTLPPHYVTLAEARQPLEFLPYQYEGYTPEERAALRSADTRMQLIGVLP
jgi:Dolichyl-phosphate-mannose-protein mannosyltransferase